MFRKKAKEHASIDAKQVVSKNDLEPYKQPMVFLFDVEETVVEKLKELRINSYEGSFGSRINVNNKKHEEKLLRLNPDYPENLHEFDVVVLDLTNIKSEDYDSSRHELNNTSGNTAHALLSTYPEQVFDPRPLSISIVSRTLNDLFEKKSIIIAFCGSNHVSEYQFVEITSRGASLTSRATFSSFSFYHDFPGHKPRSGRKVKLPEKESKLSPLFLSHLEKINFETIFYHPTIWKDGKNQEAENFVPLLFNERDEIVSYAHFVDKSIVFVFPNIADKSDFLSELFKGYLPDILPEVFPFHGEFKWIDDGNYPLPGERQLLQDRAEFEEKYKRALADNEEKLALSAPPKLRQT